jgi:hypothetical protein
LITTLIFHRVADYGAWQAGLSPAGARPDGGATVISSHRADP